MTHRITNDLSQHPDSQGDARLVNMLQLYKSPAVIRDTRQVFLYVTINANTTISNPLELYNQNKIFAKRSSPAVPVALGKVPPYFDVLGTKRSFNIGEQVNSLLDIRVPKDKYMVEIQLVEAQLETDPHNYVLQPNLDAIPESLVLPGGNPDKLLIDDTFDIVSPDEAPPSEIIPPPVPPATVPVIKSIRVPYLNQARKKSIPQPLFVRIPQMDNGEPYNWTVTNNGGVNDDKNHNVLIRHGDVDYSQLEIEFGHLVFEGQDNDYQKIGEEVDPNSDFWQSQSNSKVLGNLANYNKYRYLDYNNEWPNAYAPQIGQPNEDPQFVTPVHRGRSIMMTNSEIDESFSDLGDHRIATVPLKTNQQCSNILFRFSIKVIHLF